MNEFLKWGIFFPLQFHYYSLTNTLRASQGFLFYFVKNVDYAEIQVELDGAVEERRTRPVDRAAVRHPRRLPCGKDVDRQRRKERKAGERNGVGFGYEHGVGHEKVHLWVEFNLVMIRIKNNDYSFLEISAKIKFYKNDEIRKIMCYFV
jgi:hypothetical protein